jgi:FG-GAP-like repeat
VTITGWVRRTVIGLSFLVAVGVGCWYLTPHSTDPILPVIVPLPPLREATFEQVRQFCGVGCHGYPPPDSFPRSAWRKEVEQGFHFANRATPGHRGPSLEGVIAYYENRAPLELALPSRPVAPGQPCIRWERRGHAMPGRDPFPEIVNVNLVRLTPGGKLQILVCECDPLKNEGRVLLVDPHVDPPTWKVLAKVPAPAHAEVVDLDGDGNIDIIVACLGQFFPTDEKVGSVVWLRGRGDGTFEPTTLLRDVGRVADVQAADFHGNGKLDLIVAEFGWRQTGSILLLENRTTDWSKPQFVPRVLDDRHGTIHVPVADLNGDGRPDFVALISQEHETVVAFLNEGGGKFRKEVIYAAPHPAYGSSGIQLVDLDGDGDLDVLYTNGDVLDKPFLLKPYHGVHWLENCGRYPFTHHRLADMPGVMRAVAADVDGDGDMDIIAVSYLPAEEFPRRNELDLDAVLWLEQTTKGTFVRRPLETKSCDHFTCAIGDLMGDGRPSLVVGNFWSTKQRPMKDAISIWSPLKVRAK